MKNTIRFLTAIVLSVLIKTVFSQEQATVFGVVTDERGRPVELVNVAAVGYSAGSVTNEQGYFEFTITAGKEIFIDFSFIGYESSQVRIQARPGERIELNAELKVSTTNLPDFEVRDEQLRRTNYIRLDPKEAAFVPTISGGIEDLLRTLPGVSSTNEMSSQYSVRGGNYDENLVYVNGIEIYRPFLIRSGQQEGLSFIYPQLVSSIQFSAGGFDARYGDKMSSVLDIKYKKPTEFSGSAEASLLGAQSHIEGLGAKGRFSYLVGARYKTNQYILNALEIEGNYQPNFVDVQSLFTYDLSENTEISFLGHMSRNNYKVVPETRETNFGTFQEAYQLRVYFEGQELDRFLTYTGAVSLIHKPRKDIELQFTASAYNSVESETYDILGQYWIGLLENASNEQSGNVVAVQGVGSYLDHARNELLTTVISGQHRGTLEKESHFITWGLHYQHEIIDDKLSEWEMIDSAGYSLPDPPTQIGDTTRPLDDLKLHYSVKSKASLSSNRFSGFIQDTWNFYSGETELSLTAGARASYWDLNSEFLLSPRGTLAFDPKWKGDIVFRLSAGWYYQPPFYRELRDLEGRIHPDLRAQRSIHLVAGSDLNFTAWERPFKFVAEVYYKFLDNLIPYVVDNVRIRYYGDNSAKGYATGIDMKVNGEFIRGIESWASLSVMKTEEDLFDDFYYRYYNESGEQIIPGITVDDTPFDSMRVEPGYIPRPTDQRVNFALFFQDYLPKNPTYRMHLKLIFGTGLPFGPPDSPKYEHTLRYPAYRRVDLGFSKQLIGGYSSFKKNNPLKYIKNAWISLEVFNLFQVSNTVSYTWVSDISGRQYAVPNYLTPRQVNLRLLVDF